MIFRLDTAYNKHEMIKIGNQIRKKIRKYYRKCSNNFAVDCMMSFFHPEPQLLNKQRAISQSLFDKDDVGIPRKCFNQSQHQICSFWHQFSGFIS